MEVIDIGLDNLEPVTFNLQEDKPSESSSSNNQPSVNFGPGVELLMNDKQIPANASTKVDMADLDKLEDELNDLSKTVNLDDPPANPSSEPLGGFSNIFNFGNSKEIIKIK